MKFPIGKVLQQGPLSIQYVRVVLPIANATVPVGHLLDNDSPGCSVVDVDKFCHIRPDRLLSTRSSIGVVADVDSVTAVLRLETLALSEGR